MNKPLAAEYTFAQFSPQKSLRAQPKTSSVSGGSVLNAVCLLLVWELTMAVIFIPQIYKSAITSSRLQT